LRSLLTGLALSSALLGLAPAGFNPVAASPEPSGLISPNGPIKHVVILYQENHTFDDVLGVVCEARTNPCDGYTGPVTFKDGITAENVVQPDLVPSVTHDPHSQRLGITNRWDRVMGCRDAPYYCVSHVDPSNIPNLANYANTFTVSDATFAAGHAASFSAHVSLGAGTFDGFSGWNPFPGLWGCEARSDAYWGPRKDLNLQPTCIPDEHGDGPYRPSEVPYAPTIMERLEQKHLSWHIYEGQRPQVKPDLSNFSVCTFFYWCYDNRYTLQWDSSDQGFLLAAAHGTLPNLSIMIPDFGVSQHNNTSMAKGDNYIGKMVSAVMNGPDWESTAIFITYDDCGCFYDHVKPPTKKMGLRNPMVIISPWAKPQGTDSTPAIQPYSALAFVEQVFQLRPLSKEVSAAYDYANSFDFTQEPLSGVPMVHIRLPKSELRKIARLMPLVENDPT
jgi:phospholipase C